MFLHKTKSRHLKNPSFCAFAFFDSPLCFSTSKKHRPSGSKKGGKVFFCFRKKGEKRDDAKTHQLAQRGRGIAVGAVDQVHDIGRRELRREKNGVLERKTNPRGHESVGYLGTSPHALP